MKEMCQSHKPKVLPYLQWHEWARQKIKEKQKQKQCPHCKYWFFPEEF